MALAQVAAGTRAVISQINAYYDLLKGVSGEVITLVHNAAPSIKIQPSSDPAASTDAIQINNNAGTVLGAITYDGKFEAADGAVGAPGITFDDDTDTGIYRTGANAMAVTAGGVQVSPLAVATATARGFVPTPPNNTTDFLRGDATWAVPSPASHGASLHTDRTRNIFIPSTAFTPINGTPALNVRTYYVPMAFDAAAVESAGTQWAVPEDYASGAVTVKLHWTNAATSAGAVAWKVLIGAVADGESLNPPPALGSNTDTITAPATAELLKISTMTSSVTPAVGEILTIVVERTGNAGGDTLANDAWMVGVEIEYTADM